MLSLFIFAGLDKINIVLHTPTLINSTILGKEINCELQSLLQHCEESLPGLKLNSIFFFISTANMAVVRDRRKIMRIYEFMLALINSLIMHIQETFQTILFPILS